MNNMADVQDLNLALCLIVGKPEGKNHWGDPDVDGRIILRWIFRKWEGVVGTGWSWLSIGTDRWRALVSMVMNLQVPKI